jgi:hypothetical protein
MYLHQLFRNKVNQGTDPKPIKKSVVVAKERSETDALTFKDFADSIVSTKRAEWRNLKHGDQWAYSQRRTNSAILFVDNSRIAVL